MIDVNFDFTLDSPHYWDNFWQNNGGLGGGNCDPDSASKKLRKYNQELWSRLLPNGKKMELSLSQNGSLKWGSFRFGSDSIIVSFRYERQRKLLEELSTTINNYREFVENFLHQTYTIGGEIIFPKHKNSINQARGTNPQICDRFDLTLECIRRYYSGQNSPLSTVVATDKDFFDLFIDFKGYVDFFLLQDLVSKDYSVIKFWDDWHDFSDNPLPQTVNEYMTIINNELTFVDNRNRRTMEQK
jgi:hypothetical protein